MSFNLRQTAVAVLLTSAFVGGASLAVSACSSTTETTPGVDDAGTEAATPKPRPDAAIEDAGKKKTPQECYQDCLAANPNAKAQYEAVDTCWAAKCKGPCLEQSGSFDAGAPVDAGDDADAGTAVDAGADAGGLCGTTIGSGGDVACDTCTETFCCAEWGACYGDKKCSPIDECLGDCL